ncbi:hypothetical protein AVEN_124662-1 [Araneus ventricosus]|uniref:Uncharacterized protein n=1 Tax=Araneus ventricosus TaxID=182803 RepID=A0A4Y2KJ67_ARAVE|nr:hypothetical protein AVEN_124662-1 [Araneus ventricosus]
MGFTFLYLSEDPSWRVDVGEEGRLLFRKGIPLHKDLRYQGTVWGQVSFWSFDTKTNFRIIGSMWQKNCTKTAVCTSTKTETNSSRKKTTETETDDNRSRRKPKPPIIEVHDNRCRR